MLKHSVTTTFAALASVATSLLLVAAAPSLARAAELKLLSPFSFRALLPDLLPQFEKSSGHTFRAHPIRVVSDPFNSQS